jgi:signal transduction histidine kinase
VAWGAHLCHFYRTREDLADVLVPFFRAGLDGGDRCVWVTAAPLHAQEARAALGAVVPDLSAHERAGRIRILDHADWYAGVDEAAGSTALVQRWLALEDEARAQGFRGLRLTGNTSWLPCEQFSAFAAYEERAHAAFHDRRILAVCSYDLERCSSDQLVEVLRNHGSALVRRHGAWDVVRSATFMLAALDERELAVPGHEAHLYAGDALPAAPIARHLAQALARHGGAVVVATRAHRAAIRAALAAEAVDVAGALAAGTLLELDAEAWLALVAPAGGIDTTELDALVRAMGAVRANGPVHLYGEIVDLLCRRGRLADAVLLERQWNRVLGARTLGQGAGEARVPDAVLCGYSLDSFEQGPGGARARSEVCDAHHRVHEAPLRDSQRPLVRVRGEWATEHLALLQRVTAALSEATSVQAVGAVVISEMTLAVGADQVVLALPIDEGRTLEVVAQVGVDADVVERFARFSVDLPLPLAGAFRSGAPVWLASRDQVASAYPEVPAEYASLACVPLVVGGRRIGVLGFAFAEAQPFTTAQRALLTDLARQAAFSVDRARLFDEAERARDHLQVLYDHAEEARRRAEEANRAKDEFLAMLGHELRNPLSPIVTALSLMRLRDERTFERERAVIERQVSHVQRLVDDLLDVSRVTRGKVALTRERVELASIVQDAIETVSPLLEARQHELRTRVPTRGLELEGDRHRLTQVVANLLTNAAKYTPPGGHIDVEATVEGTWVGLRIRDDGIGIEPELLPTVFELFTQAPRGIDRSQGGLGLGLAIVQSLVSLHGGRVRAHSEGADRGTEIVVELPRAGSGATVVTARGPREATPSTTSPRRVLVVDDNRDAALLLEEAIRCRGHEVRSAFDGPSALREAAALRPHVALLDIGLPVMDGHELAQRLAATLDPPPLLVALTGYGLVSDRARTTAAGFREHLVKPVDVERVLSLLDTL